MAEFLAWLILSFACGALCGRVAHAKGRSAGAWFAAGFALWMLALIAIAGMPVEGEKHD